jgi:hypothetical protein
LEPEEVDWIERRLNIEIEDEREMKEVQGCRTKRIEE